MITWELQRWERHIFDVFAFAGVVFPRGHNVEAVGRKENEVFWVDVTFFTLFALPASLVELRL